MNENQSQSEELLVQDREIVVPGQILASGMGFVPAGGIYRDGEKIISQYTGAVSVANRVIKVIPLRGRYAPKRGDIVIGKIIDVSFSNWFVDIGCSNLAALSNREIEEFTERGTDLSQIYTFGDYIVAKISNVNRSGIDLTMKEHGLRKLSGGILLHVDSPKVPRIIGKQGSMITLIKEKTGCRITVGQNGLVWIQGTPEQEQLAVEVIHKVNSEGHREGLTEEIEKFLQDRTGGK